MEPGAPPLSNGACPVPPAAAADGADAKPPGSADSTSPVFEKLPSPFGSTLGKDNIFAAAAAEAEAAAGPDAAAPAAAPEDDGPPAVCALCGREGMGPNSKSRDALVRGCVCKRDKGLFHMKCLVAQAEGEGGIGTGAKPEAWRSCPKCKQLWFGEVQLWLAKSRWCRLMNAPVVECGIVDDDRMVAEDDYAQALQDVACDHRAALPHFRNVHKVSRTYLGPEHESTLSALHNLAQCHLDLGRPAKALPLAEEALRIYRLRVTTAKAKAKLTKKKQSKKAAVEAQADDVECVFVMSLLSRIHTELGDFNAALPLAREVLANRRKWFSQPNDQLATMVAASDLARLYAQAGGAVMAAEQVAERMRRAEDQRVARQAKEEEERKAEWLASGGTIEEWDNGEAEWTEEEEDDEEEKEQEQEQEDFSLSEEERAALAKEAEAKAMALYEEAEGMGRKLGTHHPETLTCVLDLGCMRCARSDFSAGLPLIREAVAGRAKVLGDEHAHTLAARKRLEGALAQRKGA